MQNTLYLSNVILNKQERYRSYFQQLIMYLKLNNVSVKNAGLVLPVTGKIGHIILHRTTWIHVRSNYNVTTRRRAYSRQSNTVIKTFRLKEKENWRWIMNSYKIIGQTVCLSYQSLSCHVFPPFFPKAVHNKTYVATYY